MSRKYYPPGAIGIRCCVQDTGATCCISSIAGAQGLRASRLATVHTQGPIGSALESNVDLGFILEHITTDDSRGSSMGARRLSSMCLAVDAQRSVAATADI